MLAGCWWYQAWSAAVFPGSPDGIRTRATALRGRRARPLHNGALAHDHHSDETAEAYQLPLSYTNQRLCVAGVLGLEPRLTEPESVGLPITLYPTGVAAGPRTRPGTRTNPTVSRKRPQTMADCSAQLRSRPAKSATWVRSFINRDSPYASTANSANPPTSNPASTQPIPLIALSAATEVVSPAIR